MYPLTNAVLSAILEREPFLNKSLTKEVSRLTPNHQKSLEYLLSFLQTEGLDIDTIVSAYLDFINYFLEERRYFYRHNTYRYASYQETAQLYNDPKYMRSYMIGLSLSIYLMKLQRDNMDFFLKFCQNLPTPKKHTPYRLLEVGTGHGTYFVNAMQNTSFESYYGIDVSPTSVAITKKYTEYCLKDQNKNYSVEEKDFFTLTTDKKYDVIIMGEILEHVEQPLNFLLKAKELATESALIYLSAAINSPFPDHIYLFNTVQEVKALFDQAGLSVIEERIITPENISLEKAITKKYDIVAAFILK